MIRQGQPTEAAQLEPQAGRPEATGEGWLGRDRGEKRRLWERLNPRHRKQLRVLAEALALRQNAGRLPEPLSARLSAAIEELERVAARIGALLQELARRTPPRG
jgi:septal ring factor EnvC (AmiA/AmiB activator)